MQILFSTELATLHFTAESNKKKLIIEISKKIRTSLRGFLIRNYSADY